MLKKILFFILLLPLTQFCYSQEREAIIVFNDSTFIKGFGEIKNEKIYFRVSQTSEISKWSYDMAKGLTFTGYGFSEKYEYIKPDKYSPPILMEVIEEGNVCLYKNNSFGLQFGIGASAGISTSGGVFAGVGPSLNYDMKSVFYVKRPNESYATDITFSFKSRSLRYFADCKILIEKINKKEFKKETITQMVYYYNDYCGEEVEN